MTVPAKWRFVLAFFVTLAVGLVAVAVVSLQAIEAQHPSFRPTAEPTEPFTVFFSANGGELERLNVDGSGNGCQALQKSDLLARACANAAFTDGPFIGSFAEGRLNFEYGYPFEAIVWRARLSQGASFCASAGLLGSWLARCQTEATQATYTVTDQGVTVEVPLDVSSTPAAT